MQLQDSPLGDIDPATLTPRAEELGTSYVGWLDGMRAICSTYVVLHHIYIGTYRSYNIEPYPHLGWLSFGQLAVVAFIVISGYSLALKPLKTDLTLKEGSLGFLRRRAWRILPPYWAALVFAMAYHLLVQKDLLGYDSLRSFLVHAFLLQDILHNHAPNGAFWSIAVESQIYLLFPFVLALSRRSNVVFAVTLLSGLTVLARVAAEHFPALARVDHLSPQLFIAFLIGYLAAWLTRQALHRAFIISASIISMIAFAGYLTLTPVAVVESQYYWGDIAFAVVVGLLFLMFSIGSRLLRRTFAMLRLLGSISYSVYLTHLIILHPILAFSNIEPDMTKRLAIMYGLGLPATLFAGYIFFLVFERPFLTIRSWRSLRQYLTATLSGSAKDCSQRSSV